MPGNDELLAAFADALDAAAQTLRDFITATPMLPEGQISGAGTSAVERAKRRHPELGPRQAEIIAELEKAGGAGSTTGVIRRSINYEQANVYLTLQALVGLGFVHKDEASRPHRYRLTSVLGGATEDAAAWA